MLRAISFGVFCRFAPSTRAIIRSMKLSPGRWVMRTTMRSERTFVPPVTAERSPPDSRITGADSPGDRRLVDAGDALDDVAVAGDRPGRPRRRRWSPWRRSGAGTSSSVRRRVAPGVHVVSRRAVVSCRARRSVCAWALPRPSATASARLAKTTVSQSQTVIDQANTVGCATARTVVTDRADLDDEHDGVAPERPRVELAQRVGQGPQQQRGVEQPAADPACAGTPGRRPAVAWGATVGAVTGVPPRADRGRGRAGRSARRGSP